MSQVDLAKILLAPVVTEKASMAEADGRYVFRVVKTATKGSIKAAVKAMFDVDVESVNVQILKGKTKRAGRRMGRRQDMKRAYIKLKAGQVIHIEAAQ